MNLKELPLFKGVNTEELESILEKVAWQKREFQKGELMIECGREVAGLWILTSGVARAEMVSYSGKTMTIEEFNSPSLLAAAFIYGKQNKFPVNVMASTDVEMLFIAKEWIPSLFQQSPTIMLNYITMISNRAQFLTQKIRFISFKTIKAKFSHYIVELSKGDDNQTVILRKNQEQLAELFGVTRPSLARAIGEMNSDMLIQSRGKEIKILDRSALQLIIETES